MNARAWAGRIVGLAGDADLPTYGSDAWEAAPLPVQLASAVRAAEAWRRDCDPLVLAARLDIELEAARLRDEQDYAGWRAAASRVVAIGLQPSHDELSARRRQIPDGSGRRAGRAPAPTGAPTLVRAAGDSR